MWAHEYKHFEDSDGGSEYTNRLMDLMAAQNYGDVVTAMRSTALEALNIAIAEIQEMFREKLDISQPIYITKIYDVLNNLDEIVDVTNVTIENETGGLYSDESLNLKEYISADGRILYAPENVIYELKYPNLDIKGTIK